MIDVDVFIVSMKLNLRSVCHNRNMVLQRHSNCPSPLDAADFLDHADPRSNIVGPNVAKSPWSPLFHCPKMQPLNILFPSDTHLPVFEHINARIEN